MLRVTDRDGSNTVVFAAKAGAPMRAGGGALSKPAALAEAPWKELRGAFSRIASAWQRWRRNDQATDQANVIAPSSSRP